MQKKIDFILKLGMIIFSIFMICFFVIGMKADTFIMNDISYSITKVENMILSFFMAIVFLIFFFSVPPFGFITYYLIYRTIIQNRIRKNAKFERQNLEYCREHLNHLSPTLLSYLDNFALDYEKDISSHILKLIYEKYIIVENNQLIITNKDTSCLSEADLFILSSIKTKKINFIFKAKYEQLIEKEAKEQNLIVNKGIEKRKLVIEFFGIFFFCSIFSLLSLSFLITTIHYFSIILIIINIIVMVLPVLLIVYLLMKIMIVFHSKSNLIRTKKGNRILKDALGLKSFLQDFSVFVKVNTKMYKKWKITMYKNRNIICT